MKQKNHQRIGYSNNRVPSSTGLNKMKPQQTAQNETTNEIPMDWMERDDKERQLYTAAHFVTNAQMKWPSFCCNRHCMRWQTNRPGGDKALAKKLTGKDMTEWQHKWPHMMSVSSQKHTITIQVRWVKEMSEWKDTCLDEAAQMTDQCNETKSWMTYQKCIMGAASDIQSMRRALGMLKPQPANDQHVYNDHTTITYCMYSSLSQGTRTHNVERKHNNNTPWHRLWLLMYTYNLDQSRKKKEKKKSFKTKEKIHYTCF